MADEVFERGMAIRREMFGDDFVERAEGRRTELDSDFRDMIARHVYGEVWARPGLDRRTRSCVTVSILVALGRLDELALHLRGALANGVTRDELREVLLQAAIYAGVPAANAAFGVAVEVLGGAA